jgi:hypothetical protein
VPSQNTVVTGLEKTVDPALRPQSSDEIVAGGEYEIIPDGRLGLTYVHRTMNHVVEDMSRDEAITYFIGNPGYGLATDFPKAVRDYDAVSFHFSKAFSDQWMAQASYTLSRLYGNYAGLYRPETGQIEPNVNTDFDLISIIENRTGPLPGDRTHQLKLYGARELVLNSATSLSVGLSYRTRSGAPINYYASHVFYGADEVFVLPRGSGGRLPWTHDVDGHLGFTYKLGKDSAITFLVDVFNLFNFAQAVAVDQRLTDTDLRPYVPPAGKNPEEVICISGRDPNCVTPLVTTSGDRFDVAEVNPNFKKVTAYQPPRTFRFGAKVSF